ncbi:MAG: hypothetical protein RIS72_388, partial [Pseudomonadota bacterium]
LPGAEILDEPLTRLGLKLAVALKLKF